MMFEQVGKFCPRCGEPWRRHLIQGSALISPKAWRGPATLEAVATHICWVNEGFEGVPNR